ncbi:hypothetical protein ABT297_34560 [Dactylosporangium sp. NPDC000555]|uniref:hypothetical protein n=1 Tax=Dactylosporangium sp. NPDC000555 TaxID=3154260 RepID=UPI003320BB6A
MAADLLGAEGVGRFGSQHDCLKRLVRHPHDPHHLGAGSCHTRPYRDTPREDRA